MMQPEERSEQWHIENDWELNKLLITCMKPKMFFYKIGQYEVYVQSVRPIPTVIPRGLSSVSYHFGNNKTPHLAVTRTRDKDGIIDFIADCPDLQVSRIFKSGLYFPDLNRKTIGGFSKSCVKNALNLVAEPKSFRFKSNRKELRDILYKDAVLINEQDECGHTFDYDAYDYTLEARVYKRDNGTNAIVTLLYGFDMPNHWHY